MEPLWRHPVRRVLRFEFPLPTITFPFNDDGLGVVQQPIEQRCGQGAVVVTNLGPVLKRSVGGDQGRALLIAHTDHLEEHVRPALINGKIAELVQSNPNYS
jgi:hypothetical protein